MALPGNGTGRYPRGPASLDPGEPGPLRPPAWTCDWTTAFSSTQCVSVAYLAFRSATAMVERTPLPTRPGAPGSVRPVPPSRRLASADWQGWERASD